MRAKEGGNALAPARSVGVDLRLRCEDGVRLRELV